MLERVRTGPRGLPASARPARLLTGVYASATVVALLLTVFARRGPEPGLLDQAYGVINVPVAPTFVSVVVLGLMTRALMGRKRVGLWLVAVFQVFGLYLGVVEQIPGRLFPMSELWRTRGDLGRVVDAASVALAVVALVWLWRLRHHFTGRLQRGSWWLSLGALLAGSAVTFGVAWLLLGAVGVPRSYARAVVGTVIAALGGVSRRSLEFVPPWVVEVVALCAGVTILAAVALFLASSRRGSRWTPGREVELRTLLARHGGRDSLGYFATRRDRASVFSHDGRAAVTYRVVAGVSLASSDPIGDPDSWARAIEAWRAEAREFGWLPAVIAASEAGARAYAASGMRVLVLGDEAILDPTRFDLRRTSLSPVRQAAKRATRAGVSVRIRRQHELDPDTLAELARAADRWRLGGPERGFSMALGRQEDAADREVLHVCAHGPGGDLVGLLSFVPWGRSGVSLDIMRRAADAPNGVTELMVSELLGRAGQIGITRVSLNFCMFRSVFTDAERLGSRSLTRLNASVLGVFDRLWQLERLYRATEKYGPDWSPRFLCYDDAVSLPQVVAAAGVVEGFLPWPTRRVREGGRLDPEHLAQVTAIDESDAVDVSTLEPRRSGQFQHRLATLARMRESGMDAYPVGDSTPSTTIARLAAASWTTGRAVSLVGRVKALRDHGSVVFVTLVDGHHDVQLLLDAAGTGRGPVRSFACVVDVGDLVRVAGVTGASRAGSPSVLVTGWRMEAKSLHPVPFGALEDPQDRARQRSTDLLVHPRALDLLRQRSAVVSGIRRHLTDAGFLEVETPVLQTTHGGASARPFRTYSNAYAADLSLRIAPELYLKRLLVAGMGPIFELGRSFRNEGADATHNPEFTSLEVYQPHADYTVMRHLAERLVKDAAFSVHGAEVLPLPTPAQLRGGTEGVTLVDVSGPWRVVPVLEAVSRAVGTSVSVDTDMDVLLGLAEEHAVPVRAEMGPGAVIEELYAELVERVTLEPTFYTDFPVETSPLTHPHRTEVGLVERWDLVIAGMEIGTAYSELTDPVDQRLRLTEQSLKAAAGDPGAMQLDEDFLRALETGMPPSGGLGIGVDRLVMLLTNTSIRSVLTFPFVRPHRPQSVSAEPAWDSLELTV